MGGSCRYRPVRRGQLLPSASHEQCPRHDGAGTQYGAVTPSAADLAELALAAARDNAAWCHAMCRAHGVVGRFGPAAWTSPVRTPPLYPDAVTLARGVPVEEILARIDTGVGCSVKDSFADVHLSSHGFTVLFEASWIHRPADARLPTPSRAAGATGHGRAWEVVTSPAALTDWEHAWRGSNGPTGLFRAELLADPAVEVLAARTDGRIVAGATLSLAGGAVGVSNLFVTGPAEDAGAGSPWPGLLAAITARHPGLPVVGYEQSAGLEQALQHGFRVVGRLRVWLRHG
jgi:hypothetical protein